MNDIAGMDRILWNRKVFRFQRVANLLDPASPTLDETRQIKHVGDIGIIRFGRVFAHQIIRSPPLRKTPDIRDVQSVFIHADLDWDAGLILFVTDRVQQGLAERFFRNKVPLYSLGALIANLRLHVFQVDHFQRLVYLFEDRTANLVLIKQVGVVFKIADFEKGALLVSLRVFAEEERRRVSRRITRRLTELLSNSRSYSIPPSRRVPFS